MLGLSSSVSIIRRKEDEKNIVDVLVGNRTLEEVIAEIKQKYIKKEA